MRNTSQLLAVYNQNASVEFELPPISIGIFHTEIQKDLFGLKNDISLNLEVLDESWCFSEDRTYRVVYGKDVYFLKPIVEKTVFELITHDGEKLILMLFCKSINMAVYKKFLLDKKDTITIGSLQENIICYKPLSLRSRHHANLRLEQNNWVISDTSSNGTFVNGKGVKGSQVLNYGDIIDVFGVRIIFLKDILAIDMQEIQEINESFLKPADDEIKKWLATLPVYTLDKKSINIFHRAPRTIASYDTEPFEIEAPPAPKERENRSIFMTIGPSFTMAIPMVIGVVVLGTGQFAFGLITMVGAAVIGAFWAYLNYSGQKKRDKESEENRLNKYREYLKTKEQDLKKKYDYNRAERLMMYPSSAECSRYDGEETRLWNRNTEHDDFLSVRLGTGEIPLPSEIIIPQERFTLIDDSLQNEPARIQEKYKKMQDVPVCLDLMQHHLIGITGGEGKKGIYQVLRNIMVQIAACNSYTDVKLVLLCDNRNYADRQLLENAKWLPHMWDDENRIRYAGDSEDSIGDVLLAFRDILSAREQYLGDRDGQKRKISNPWYVIISTDTRLLGENSIIPYLYEKERNCGTTTILCSEKQSDLPNSCDFIIKNENDYSGMFSVKDALQDRQKIVFDQVTDQTMGDLGHRLASIRIQGIETEKDLPSSMTFFEMYHVNNVQELDILERWKTSRSYRSLSVPFGKSIGNKNTYLDIHESAHGPHGLVAGTTGSGKSEMLQSYLLSLAVNFSPEDINFLIIDFKGGGMANHLSGLPHMAGQITNLSGNQVRRAMVSINSEIERRQRIFNESGAHDIYEYTQLYKNKDVLIPLPHLLIVVDEFAELKKQQPEFMGELISVAAVGRSLGVHLILATQKPNGTVDDKIQSNTRFRVCLRVQDTTDSKDMLNRPDAANITQVGRGYLRVGNDELFEIFQSAWSGAPNTGSSNQNVEVARLYKVNGKTVIVGDHRKKVLQEEAALKWCHELLVLINDLMNSTGISGRDYLVNEEKRRNFNSAYFQSCHNRDWNIIENDNNRKKLLDLIMLIEEAGINELITDQAAAKVRSLANATKRNLPEIEEKTQLDAVVEYLQRLAQENDLCIRNALWMPSLPTRMALTDMETYRTSSYIDGKWPEMERGSLNAVVGLMDDPVHQSQRPAFVDFINQGHYAVCGNVSSGKSTFLQTLIYSMITRYSPENLNIYIIDFSSRMLEPFVSAPHVGGIMFDSDRDKISKFFFMMKHILAERKDILRGGSFSQYVRTGRNLPAILIIIDGYSSFREKTDQVYDATMLELAREGINNGIFLVISANGFGNAEIPFKLSDMLKGNFCLQMNGRSEYMEAMKVNRLSIFPEEGIKGRGLTRYCDDVLEYQTALAISSYDDYQRSEKIKTICEEMNKEKDIKSARGIPVVPENPIYNDFIQLEEVKSALADDRSLPLGYLVKSASVWNLDLSKIYCYIVSGRQRTGKTNFLQMAIKIAMQKGGKGYVIADQSNQIEQTALETGAKFLSYDDDMRSLCLELKPLLMERNKKEKALEHQGYSDTEIYQEMCKEENIYIFIDDIASFVERVYKTSAENEPLNGFFETMFSKGWYHQIFIFGSINPDDRFKVAGKPLFDAFIKDRSGIHFGGNAASQQILEFSYLSLKEQSKPEPKRVGILASGLNMDTQGEVVIPSANNKR
jgi:S-DNA-T family DNA segregation ATPase FtsK/SpoIIIE